jgi:hypothetical protein
MRGTAAGLFIILYTAGMLFWCVKKWVDYGIYEHNLLRCVVHTLLAPVWSIALAVYAARALRKYVNTRLKKDYDELFGKRPVPAPEIPPRVDVTLLAETKPLYKPGDWIN